MSYARRHEAPPKVPFFNPHFQALESSDGGVRVVYKITITVI